jgi:hypothetical protein
MVSVDGVSSVVLVHNQLKDYRKSLMIIAGKLRLTFSCGLNGI